MLPSLGRAEFKYNGWNRPVSTETGWHAEMNLYRLVSCGVCLFLLSLTLHSTTRAESPISFARDIRPILSDSCFACHGPDENERQADLRLDVGSSAYEMNAVVPRDLNESELWQRINSDDADAVMPPPKFHKPLNGEQRELIRRWIEAGAEYEQHWSFVAPNKVPVPDGFDNPIDAFIQRGLNDAGLKMAPRAGRRTSIRRVTLDLTGIPPTPKEVDAFLADTKEDAYERLIDRLMSRVSYGQHMARYWLDLARYADTHGLHLDNERSMWPYRDWVVRAFNDNVPFDEFTRWQLAGDLLENPTQDQLIASGFNRCNVTTSEGGSINEEWVYRYAVDRTTTTAEVWMGLTAGCAVCHDHKFDPITAVDYYSMYAFFHSAADPAMDGNKIDTPPILKIMGDEERTKLALLDEQIDSMRKSLSDRLGQIQYVDPATLDPPPPKSAKKTLWFDDAFPDGAKVQSSGGAPLNLVSKELAGEDAVYSGSVAVRREADGLAQDFYNSGAAPFVVGASGKIFVHCLLDAANPPAAIMIQLHSDQWKHRAVWGDESKIGFGKLGTPEKVHVGDLPAKGKWVRLEVDSAKLGINSGTKISGYAFTQFGGAVTWDHFGFESELDKVTDPGWSFAAWTKQNAGKKIDMLPKKLRAVVKNKAIADWSAEQTDQIQRMWIENVYAGIPSAAMELKLAIAKSHSDKAQIEAAAPVTFVMADLPKPRESFVMERGAYDKPGQQVHRNVPSFLPALPKRKDERDYDRLDLANWLVSGEHPLTARVTVNRLWQQFFGTGIVKTSADFGSQGEPPSHPELLDYLAVRFVEDGWDIQEFLRLILASDTYCQSSKASPDLLARDPDNRLLARGPRTRLDAEVLRDQVLFVSGLLVDKVGGKGVNPYQPPNIWEPVAFGGSNTRYYKQGKGEDLYRRSLYTFFKRTAPPPFMSTFDAPNREQSCSRRERTNTPLQALQLLNDVQHFEAARNFAARIIGEGGEAREDRIAWAWNVVTARRPTDSETQIASDTLRHYLDRYASDAEAAEKVISYGESEVDESISKSELAAYTLLANMLFNLDEVVNKN